MATFEVGSRDKKVRSDCWISYTPEESGGLQIDVKSKVQSMYGKHIISLAKEVLDALGVSNARLEIIDKGALPYVIAARIEAAVKRADPDNKNEYLPPMQEFCKYDTSKERIRRSRLYLPGSQPKLFLNASVHKPDGIILDLEDSVAPTEKDAARLIVRMIADKIINFELVCFIAKISWLSEQSAPNI